MGNDNQIGLESVWNNDQFNRGQAEYLSKIGQAEKATQSATKGGGIASDAFGIIGSSLLTLAANAGVGSGGLLALGVVMGGTMALGKALFDAITQGTQAIISFGWESVQAASRTQQLGYIAQTLGMMSGYTAQQVLGYVDAVRKAGIETGVANKLVANFARYNLDMAKAVELARVAQDAATLANEGSSDALDGIIHGLTTLSPIVLRHHGIMVNFEDAYKKYAASINVSVDSLTAEQKVTAGLNAVLENGQTIAGAYQASMMTAGKQMGTLTSRLLPDLQNALGAPFQKAFFNVVSGINNLVTGITKLISEGGALYPILINIGAAFSLITEPFAALTKVFSETGGDIFQTLADTLSNAANSALGWGYNIAAQLAQGLISGAQAAIQSAIDWIGQMLSNWFAPGSPPKVAPEIDTWGGDAMTVYLKGFTEADFGVLKGIQAPLKDALSTLVDLGAIGQGEANQVFQDLSKELMAGLTEGGTLTDDFFKRLAEAAGPFGEQIADLAKKQYELATAEDAVKNAEDALAAAKKKGSDAGAQVNKATMEYNQLLRSGASKDVLAQKLKEINAAKATQDEAKKEEIAAKDKLDTAKEQADALKEQIALQKQLVDQLLEQAKLDKELKDKEKEKQPKGPGGQPQPPGGGGGGGKSPFDPNAILDPVRDAVDKAKIYILEQLQNIWSDIQTAWLTGVNNLTKWLLETWQKVADRFGLPSIETIQNAWNEIIKWVIKQVDWFVGTLVTFWERHGKSIQKVLEGTWKFITDIFTNAGKGVMKALDFVIAYLSGIWERHGATITAFLSRTWERIQKLWENFLEYVGNVFDAWAAVFEGDWGTVWQEVQDNAAIIWDSIKILWEGLWDGISTALAIYITSVQDQLSAAWTAITGVAQTAWDGLTKAWSGFWDGITKTTSDTSDSIQKMWSDFWDAVNKKLTDIWDSIQTWLNDKIDAIFASMGLDLDNMKARWSKIWDGVLTILQLIWKNISDTVNKKITEVQTWITNVSTAITLAWNIFWDSVSNKVTEIWDAVYLKISTVWGTVQTTISDAYATIKKNWDDFWGGVSKSVTDTWNKITSNVAGAITGKDGLADKIASGLNNIITSLTGPNGILTKFLDFGKSIVDNMIKGIQKGAGDLVEAITKLIEKAIADAIAALGGGSSKTPGEKSNNIGFSGGNGSPPPAAGATSLLASSFASLPRLQAATPISSGVVQYNTITINIPTTINSSVDVAKFEQMIIKTVKKAIR